MHEVLVNRLGGLNLPRKSVVRLIDRPDMALDVYRGRKITIQQPMLLFFQLINVKMPTSVGILTFMSRKIICLIELSMKKVLQPQGQGIKLL